MTDLISPAPGLLWHRPDPGSAPFCSAGDTVTAGQQIAVIEVMKMFAPIEADVDGVFAGYLVDDGSMIEAGQAVATIEAP
jgi:acetyl-CoA carboxylase biotin carboxyl carrier protein